LATCRASARNEAKADTSKLSFFDTNGARKQRKLSFKNKQNINSIYKQKVWRDQQQHHLNQIVNY